jgi:hypothetical protein
MRGRGLEDESSNASVRDSHITWTDYRPGRQLCFPQPRWASSFWTEVRGAIEGRNQNPSGNARTTTWKPTKEIKLASFEIRKTPRQDRQGTSCAIIPAQPPVLSPRFSHGVACFGESDSVLLSESLRNASVSILFLTDVRIHSRGGGYVPCTCSL